MMGDTDVPSWISAEELAAPLHTLLADAKAIAECWTGHRLTGGVGNALGVWRLSGTALLHDERRPWSLILKGWAPPAPGATPDGLDWPHREMELYASGLLADLPGGIAAPACYGETHLPDGSAWIWLEDLDNGASEPWSEERFTTFARQLGQFNGTWLDERPLPKHPSLSREWIRHRVEASAPYIDDLQNPDAHPMVRAFFSPSVAAAYVRLWRDRERHLAALGRLPQTFCHLDAFPRNTFVRPGPDGRAQTVLIDWAFAGIAALGEELSSLIVASVLFMEAPLAEARSLEDAVLDSYVDGLRDVGWRGDPATVREGYRIAASLRYGVGGVHRFMPLLTRETSRLETNPIVSRPSEDVYANAVGVQAWMADLCDEG